MPAGVPIWLMPLMIPIEFISNILVRPISLSLRLFANMFAGHILLLVFVLGGEYMLLHSGSIAIGGVGIVTLLMALAIAGLELFVQCHPGLHLRRPDRAVHRQRDRRRALIRTTRSIPRPVATETRIAPIRTERNTLQ